MAPSTPKSPPSPSSTRRKIHTLPPRTPPSRDTTTTTNPQIQSPTRYFHQGYNTTTPLPSHHQHSRTDSYNINNNGNNDEPDQFPFPTDSPLHFSPSKARAVARQTQELAVLKRWLKSILTPEEQIDASHTSSLQHRDQSEKERLALLLSRWENEHRSLGTSDADLAAQVMQWLHGAMGMNRLADERRRLLFEARREELDRVVADDGQGVSEASAREVLAEMHLSLSDRGREVLDSLAKSAVLLGHVPEVDGTGSIRNELGRAVMETTLRAQDTQSHVDELRSLLAMLQKQLKLAKDEIVLFAEEQDATARLADSMHPKTAQWARETKQIAIKIKEYQDRSSALMRSRPGTEIFRGSGDEFVSIEDVIEAQTRVNLRKNAIAKLEERVAAFSGLPPDIETGRVEVQRARSELHTLKARREELFGILTGRQ